MHEIKTNRQKDYNSYTVIQSTALQSLNVCIFLGNTFIRLKFLPHVTIWKYVIAGAYFWYVMTMMMYCRVTTNKWCTHICMWRNAGRTPSWTKHVKRMRVILSDKQKRMRRLVKIKQCLHCLVSNFKDFRTVTVCCNIYNKHWTNSKSKEWRNSEEVPQYLESHMIWHVTSFKYTLSSFPVADSC